MTIPTSIPETPMAHSNHESFQESNEGSTSSKSMEVYQHVLNKVMDIQNEDESLSHTEVMRASLTCVVIFIIYWTIFMTTVTTEWMVQNVP